MNTSPTNGQKLTMPPARCHAGNMNLLYGGWWRIACFLMSFQLLKLVKPTIPSGIWHAKRITAEGMPAMAHIMETIHSNRKEAKDTSGGG